MITESDLKLAVRGLALEFPDMKYLRRSGRTSCAYTPDDNNPMGCIIGAALTRLGVPAECLVMLDDGPYEWGATAGAPQGADWPDDVKMEIQEHVAPEAADSPWARYVQSEQDLGAPWGEAVRRADAATGVAA